MDHKTKTKLKKTQNRTENSTIHLSTTLERVCMIFRIRRKYKAGVLLLIVVIISYLIIRANNDQSLTVWQILCQVFDSCDPPNNPMRQKKKFPSFRKKKLKHGERLINLSKLKKLVNMKLGFDPRQCNSSAFPFSHYLVWPPPWQMKLKLSVSKQLGRVTRTILVKTTPSKI